MRKTIKAYAIWHKHKDMIMDVGFYDCGDFKPAKKHFADEENGVYWRDTRYKVIPVTISYEGKPSTPEGEGRQK